LEEKLSAFSVEMAKTFDSSVSASGTLSAQDRLKDFQTAIDIAQIFISNCRHASSPPCCLVPILAVGLERVKNSSGSSLGGVELLVHKPQPKIAS
jgi:hypothetical protein